MWIAQGGEKGGDFVDREFATSLACLRGEFRRHGCEVIDSGLVGHGSFSIEGASSRLLAPSLVHEGLVALEAFEKTANNGVESTGVVGVQDVAAVEDEEMCMGAAFCHFFQVLL